MLGGGVALYVYEESVGSCRDGELLYVLQSAYEAIVIVMYARIIAQVSTPAICPCKQIVAPQRWFDAGNIGPERRCRCRALSPQAEMV